ncbi:MAG: thioredoxin family protein [Flexibacteraceae bacterium]
MKKPFYIIFTLLFVASVGVFSSAFTPAKAKIEVSTTSAEGLKFFTGTFEEALKASKKQNKPVFIDAYTDWCGWCKKMDKSTFADAKVVEELNSKFIVVKMNMEQGEGPGIAQKYGIQGYPTFLFFDEKGKEIHRIVGFVKADKFITESQTALKNFVK